MDAEYARKTEPESMTNCYVPPEPSVQARAGNNDREADWPKRSACKCRHLSVSYLTHVHKL